MAASEQVFEQLLCSGIVLKSTGEFVAFVTDEDKDCATRLLRAGQDDLLQTYAEGVLFMQRLAKSGGA